MFNPVTETIMTKVQLKNLAPAVIRADEAAYYGLKSIADYKSSNPEFSLEAATAALGRVKIGNEWVDRFARVAHVDGCEILGVQQWTDKDGKQNGAGFTLEVKMPQGGSSWRTLAGVTNELAADLRRQ